MVLRRKTRLNCTCISDADQTYVIRCLEELMEEQSVTYIWSYVVVCTCGNCAPCHAPTTELRGPGEPEPRLFKKYSVHLSPHVTRHTSAQPRRAARAPGSNSNIACWLLPHFYPAHIWMRYSADSTAFNAGRYLRRARHGASIGAVHPFPGSPPPRAGARS